jgi:phage repressor protein C with HTH and peptisase S24 domain
VSSKNLCFYPKNISLGWLKTHMSINISKNLKYLRKNLGYTQPEIAKQIGISYGAYQKYEGGSIPTGKHLLRMANFFGCTIDWLLRGEEKSDRQVITQWGIKESPIKYLIECGFTLIPKMSPRITAGGGSFVEKESVESYYAFKTTWLKRKGNIDNMFLFEVKGDSMSPTIEEGDHVLVNTDKRIIESGGNIYAFRTDETIQVKRLQLLVSPRASVISDNKIYREFEINLKEDNITVLGQIIWIGKDLSTSSEK